MPKFHVGQRAQREAGGRRRRIGALRRSVVIAGALWLTSAAGLLTAGSALASGGLEPGNLVLQPASGAISLAPMFATTDGCPTGYQGSAQVSMFGPNGTLISRISAVVPTPTAAFHGTLEGSIGALLKFAGVSAGAASQWAVGCYTGAGGTGNVRWVQYTLVKLSADGKSYSISPGNGQSASGSGNGQSASGSGNGQSPSSSATKQPALANLYGQVASAHYPNPGSPVSSTGNQAEAALIAGISGLVVAGAGIFFYRRRNRARLT
jgi:LPXTG-motif cell wall-anchored protein